MTRRVESICSLLLSMVLLGALALWSSAQDGSPRAASARETKTDFERMAAELTFLDLTSVLYDRPYRDRAADPAEVERHREVLSRISSSTDSIDDLRRLLTHDDPKVVTLAMVALFDREDPSILPDLVPLAEDERPTFDGLPELAPLRPGVFRSGPLGRRDQTVGYFAAQMVHFYMKAAGFYYGIRHERQPGFEDYWEARRDRSHCASWFWVQLMRAGHGTMPTPEDSLDEIAALRQRIEALPSDHATWVLLWLHGEAGSDALVTEEELVARCQELGPEKLMRMLRRDMPSDDPDLQPRRMNNWPYQRMTLFVLRHARDLLRAEDAPALLEQDRFERNSPQNGLDDPTISPWWAIAAAELQPASASSILLQAFESFQGRFHEQARSEICAALWRLGPYQSRFVRDWLFDEQPSRGRFPSPQGALIRSIAGSKDASAKQFVADVIRDPRFDELGWQALQEVVTAVNGWSTSPVVSAEELRAAGHPLGIAHFDGSLDEARRNHPRATALLLEKLDDWRSRLRESIPSWLR